MKPLIWLGSSLEDVRVFPASARKEAGYQLFRVQLGLEPSDWKPMASIGRGVKEIRVQLGNQYRVIYLAKYEEAVYVIHAFVKKAHKTPRSDLELAAMRVRQLQTMREKKR